MRPKKRRTSNPPPMMIDIKEDDPRLARRWKRRSIASQSSKISLRRIDCSNVDEYVVGEGNSIACRRVIHDVHDDTHNDSADDDMDPDYKIFIEKLRENGNSYILELLVSDGAVDMISYDTYDEQYGSGIVENTKTMVDFQMNNQRKESDARSSSRRRKVETQRTLRNVPGRVGKSSVAEEKVKGNVVDPILCELKDNLRTRPLPEVLDSINSKFSEQNLAEVDETYQNLLNGVKVEGSNFVFTFENGKEIIYGKDEESSMDSEVNEMDVCNLNIQICMYHFLDERDGCIENSVRKSCLQFREGVMEVLRKPFDEEYRDLFVEATLERKMVRDKELRSGPKQFQLPGCGKSYLDKHHGWLTIFILSINLVRQFFVSLAGLASVDFLLAVSSHRLVGPYLNCMTLEVRP
ncbi:hypothetical protein K2173_026841 [Erythroxylum novogranatense]|uniref:Uncharacterized protein n=1 Tax=Erythroxylum novogranatense TaxID=1862640 RepID=A0AAV8U037_9ROSI|nr:hypothetical protein K2173_026841 [Erythroxylum novogranatense]